MKRASIVLPLALLAGTFPAPGAQAQPVATPCVRPVPAPAPHVPARPASETELHELATGSGVRVAVIDTGVAPHAELPGLVPVADLVARETPDPFLDCDGHGTIVAGVIAGQTLGVAPGAQILSVRQTSAHAARTDTEDNAGGTLASLAEAVNLALDQGAQVINISVVACVDPDTAIRLNSGVLDDALARAEAQQTVVVAAAGNISPECQPGAVVYPSHSPTVLSVGGRENTHELAEYSLPEPEGHEAVSAPAFVPVALSPDANGWASGVQPDTGDPRAFHGTSFAAPVVAGTAALLRQRYPSYTAAEIRAQILASAEPSGGAVDPLSTLSYVPPAGADIASRRLAFTSPPSASHGIRLRMMTLFAGLSLAGVLGLAVAGLLRTSSSPAGRRAPGSGSRALPGPRSPR